MDVANFSSLFSIYKWCGSNAKYRAVLRVFYWSREDWLGDAGEIDAVYSNNVRRSSISLYLNVYIHVYILA